MALTCAGIGAIFETNTKALTAPPCGIRTLREILKLAAAHQPRIKTVAIGGLNSTNIARLRYQSETPSLGARLDGVAVVSALMASETPRETAADLKTVFSSKPSFISPQTWHPQENNNISDLKLGIGEILRKIQCETPLVHHLTNDVLFPNP
jgi:thiamine-phosphate diphosphorylase / hydroxyethylthiazole kinase